VLDKAPSQHPVSQISSLCTFLTISESGDQAFKADIRCSTADRTYREVVVDDFTARELPVVKVHNTELRFGDL